MAFLAFSAVIVSIGKFPSPGSEPERVFTSSQPAIADEILGVERRCFTAIKYKRGDRFVPRGRVPATCSLGHYWDSDR